MQKHYHNLRVNTGTHTGYLAATMGTFGTVWDGQDSNMILPSGEGDSGNLPPYITVYFWKRTA